MKKKNIICSFFSACLLATSISSPVHAASFWELLFNVGIDAAMSFSEAANEAKEREENVGSFDCGNADEILNTEVPNGIGYTNVSYTVFVDGDVEMLLPKIRQYCPNAYITKTQDVSRDLPVASSIVSVAHFIPPLDSEYGSYEHQEAVRLKERLSAAGFEAALYGSPSCTVKSKKVWFFSMSYCELNSFSVFAAAVEHGSNSPVSMISIKDNLLLGKKVPVRYYPRDSVESVD